jgi:hypothetical protein
MGKVGERCVYKGNADGALTIVHPGRGVHSPSSTPDDDWDPRRRDAKPTYFAFVLFGVISPDRKFDFPTADGITAVRRYRYHAMR